MSTDSINNPVSHAVSHWRDYLEITKPKVVLLLVFTALVGMALAVPGWLPLQETFFGLLGIGLASSSAAAINHVIDQRTDAIMKRTENRPIPAGALSTKQCVAFALLIGALGMFVLVAFVNVLTAVLTFFSLIGYAIIYTVYLKRATPQNIVIGGAAGAMPPVLGWAGHWPYTDATITRKWISRCCPSPMAFPIRVFKLCCTPYSCCWSRFFLISSA